MFKKTQIRAILSLLQQGRSYREIAKTLSVSKNTVISIEKILQTDSHEIEQILSFSDWFHLKSVNGLMNIVSARILMFNFEMVDILFQVG